MQNRSFFFKFLFPWIVFFLFLRIAGAELIPCSLHFLNKKKKISKILALSKNVQKHLFLNSTPSAPLSLAFTLSSNWLIRLCSTISWSTYLTGWNSRCIFRNQSAKFACKKQFYLSRSSLCMILYNLFPLKFWKKKKKTTSNKHQPHRRNNYNFFCYHESMR